MADADLQITFAADASGVQSGAEAAASSVRGLQPAIEETRKALDAFGKGMMEAVKSPDLGGVKDGLSSLGSMLTRTRSMRRRARSARTAPRPATSPSPSPTARPWSCRWAWAGRPSRSP